jgi:hypothetical protein
VRIGRGLVVGVCFEPSNMVHGGFSEVPDGDELIGFAFERFILG